MAGIGHNMSEFRFTSCTICCCKRVKHLGLTHCDGPEAVEELERQTCSERSAELSTMIPDVVDHFTPNGRTPTKGGAPQLAKSAPCGALASRRLPNNGSI